MRLNNKQKIDLLRGVLQEVVNKSISIRDYDIEATEISNGGLLVNVALSNEDGVVVKEFEGNYFDVLCSCKLILYPLI